MKTTCLLMTLITLSFSVAGQEIDHKKFNSQLRKVKAGFMISGVAFAGGAAINLIAAGKNEPNAVDYTDPYLFQRDYESYRKKQKGLQRQSNFLFLTGGAIMVISGISMSTTVAKSKNDRSVKLTANPASAGLEILF